MEIILLLRNLRALRVKILFFFVLPLIYAAIHLWGAFTLDVGGSSEARELQVISVIVREHEWILPLRNGIVPSKPPLFHWIGALAAGSTPPEPFIGRLVSAFFGTLSLCLTMWLAYRLASIGPYTGYERPKNVSLLAGFVLGTTHGFSILAQDARVDMTFTFFCTLAAASALLFALNNFSSRWRILFYAASGCAVLAKGPLGIVLPSVLAASMLYMLEGVKPIRKLFVFPFGWLIFAVLAFPWYIAATLKGGAAFTERQIIFENIQRVLGSDDTNRGPWWYYAGSFFRTALPWSLFAAFFAAKRLARRGNVRSLYPFSKSGNPIPILGIVWLLSGILLLSIPAGKRHSYLAPLFPGMAIYIAFEVIGWWDELTMRGKQAFESGLRVVGGIFLILISFLILAASIHEYPLPLNESAAEQAFEWMHRHAFDLSIMLASGALLLFTKDIKIGAALSFLIVLSVGINMGLGVKADLKGFKNASNDIASRIYERRLTVVKDRRDEYFDPVLYYLQKPVNVLEPANARDACPGMIMTRDKYLPYLQNGGALRRVSSYREVDLKENDSNSREIILLDCLSPVL